MSTRCISPQYLSRTGFILENPRLFCSLKLLLTASLQAEKADPHDAVYPSNLSAALYEAADYAACSEAVLRSWRLLQSHGDAKSDLIVRLSGRLAKSLCHGVRAKTITSGPLAANRPDIKHIRDAAAKASASALVSEELTRVWSEWDVAEAEALAYVENGREALRGFSRLPMFYKPLCVLHTLASVLDTHPYPATPRESSFR